ncbi:PA14 domain-containing protein [Aliisedimentitalea scapharcae]|uniref:PA14 domain-containing protein n=1 Tax=Aliisedimentitalea scapharcae TaxID=1524259 RepID=A0ABZ2XXU9_9RHOB|nr:hypothetical protein K3727_07875 [Rhodobacteraceae bacterium M382]
MKPLLTGTLAVVAFCCATLVAAAPLKLKPANPQPSGLRSGLSVVYAYPDEVKSLNDADAALRKGAQAGRPLKGLDYRDTNEGDKTLTSKRALHVVAKIKGYVKFDAPGVYNIDFLSNDGLRAKIGGQLVSRFDGRQPCEPTYGSEVEVPVAGWYPLDIVYFQRLGTSCLHMRSAPAGKRITWMPNKAFGH